MSEPTKTTAVHVLALKGAELSHRALILADELKKGRNNALSLDMMRESIQAVDFWAGVLEKEIEAERNYGA